MREAALFASRQGVGSAAGHLAGIVAHIARIAAGWRRRRNFAELEALDDHLLDDIGLTRGDVRWAITQRPDRPVGPELRRRAWRRARLGMG